jgi:hypothetical protein
MPRDGAPSTNWRGVCVGLELIWTKKRGEKLNSDSSTIQPLGSHYTDCAALPLYYGLEHFYMNMRLQRINK